MRIILRCAIVTMFGIFLAWPVCANEPANSEAAISAGRIATDASDFIEGNLYFMAYHELGHALVGEFALPIVGREEDAVDSLAILLMTPRDKKTNPDYLMAAMKGWFLFASETELNDIPWWDEHGTDNQRAFQISCLLYGSDPEHFETAAKLADLPQDRRESCEFDAKANSNSWDALLKDHIIDENPPVSVKPPEVVYKPTKKYQVQLDYIKELGLLEDVASLMRDNYKFEPGIKLLGEECGHSNSYWNSDNRTLTICYELVEDYQRLADGFK